MSAADRDHGARRYQVLDRIAIGGMAEVYRAKILGAHGFEKTIAIKRIRPHLLQRSEFIDRFIAEAKIAVELTHANIVQVLDFGRDEDSLYIAMEYIDGLDLTGLCRRYRDRGEPIAVPAALHVAIDLFKGLAFAHTRNVIHRDISHSNILLSRTGDVKIADFGIAKAVDSRSSLSMSRQIMGKWRYMSPEQTLGERLDARTDLFSAGVVLHETLAGRRLFDGRDIETIVHNIHTAEIPPLSALRPELPGRIDAVASRLLERDRERRYQRASDVVSDLTELCFDLRLVPAATHLAEAIERVIRDTSPVPDAIAPNRPDDAIAAELANRGVRGVHGVQGSTRVTAPARRPAPMMVGAPRPLARTQTLVTTVIDAHGMPRWELSETPKPERRRGRVWLPLLLLVIAGGVGGAVLAFRGEPHPQTAANNSAEQPDASMTDAARVAHPVDAGVSDARRPATARLAITSQPPGARILLDNKHIGKTPFDGPVPADGGEHSVVLELRGHRSSTARVTLSPGGDHEVARTLAPTMRYGRVKIFAQPWAYVYLRGRKIAETPVSLRLPHGRHRLRLRNPVQKLSATLVVNVPGGGPYRVQLR